jgi:hypothetical protein
LVNYCVVWVQISAQYRMVLIKRLPGMTAFTFN